MEDIFMKKRMIVFFITAFLSAVLPALQVSAAMSGNSMPDTDTENASDVPETDTDEEDISDIEGDEGWDENQYELTFDEADKSYPHDSQFTVKLYGDKESRSLGRTNIEFQFTEKDTGKMYTADIRWDKIDLTTDPDYVTVEVPYLIPKGDYDIYYAIMNPSADYTYFSYQNEMNVQKGQAYTLVGLLGNEDWIKENKENEEIVPETYQNMGSVVWPNDAVEALENDADKSSYNIAPEGRSVFLDSRYIETWVHLTNDEKDAFLNSVPDTEDANKQFYEFCKANGIKLVASIEEIDGGENVKEDAYVPTPDTAPEQTREASSDEEPAVTKKDYRPIIMKTVIILIIIFIGFIISRVIKNKMNEKRYR